MLVVNINDAPCLLRNDGGNRNHWLAVDARLPNGRSHAAGARVSVTANGITQVQHMALAQGYLSQSAPRPHFGFGKAARAEKVEIRWTNGKTAVLENVPANQFLKVIQPGEVKALATFEAFCCLFLFRVKGTEMFWNDPSGAEPILQVRAAALCDDDRLTTYLATRPGCPYIRRPVGAWANRMAHPEARGRIGSGPDGGMVNLDGGFLPKLY